MLVLVCCWKWIKALLSPQLIFCFPWKAKNFVTLKSQVQAKAASLNEISFLVVWNAPKLLDMSMCNVEVFLMRMSQEAFGGELIYCL